METVKVINAIRNWVNTIPNELDFSISHTPVIACKIKENKYETPIAKITHAKVIPIAFKVLSVYDLTEVLFTDFRLTTIAATNPPIIIARKIYIAQKGNLARPQS